MILLSSLHQGGAERQILNLLQGLDPARFGTLVVTYYPGGEWEALCSSIPGVRLTRLDLQGRFDLQRMFFTLRRLAREWRPHILYGLMGDACTLALLHGKLSIRSRVVWGLRATNVDFRDYSRTSGMIYRLNARLSPICDGIIANSYAGAAFHASQGYAEDKILVIPNGIDTAFFRPDPGGGEALRQELGIGPETPVIGRAGRLDPMKDYPTFLRAAAVLSALRDDVRFLVAGDGPEARLREYQALADSLGLQHKVRWLGPVGALPAFYASCALTSSSSSYGEGFPNVVAESMACETLCVATDVGDSRRIVQDPALVTAPGDPEALARAWAKVLDLSEEKRKTMGIAARQRILQNFSIEKMVRATTEFFETLAAGGRAR